MKKLNNKIVFKTNRADLFELISSSIIIGLSAIVFFFLTFYYINLVDNSKLNDPKINKILDYQDNIKEDYNNALDCDGKVTINKDEDIVVTVETSNYKLSDTFDINGNLVSSKLESIITPSEVINSFIASFFVGVACYFVLFIPCFFIKRALKKKDDYEKYAENSYESSKLAMANARKKGDQKEILETKKEHEEIVKKFGLDKL